MVLERHSVIGGTRRAAKERQKARHLGYEFEMFKLKSRRQVTK